MVMIWTVLLPLLIRQMKITFNIKILLFTFIFCVFGNTTQSQGKYESVDAFALTFKDKYETIEDLAQKLSASFNTEEEKARVFFMWIANNIKYDCKKFHRGNKHSVKARSEQEFLRLKKKIQEEELAKAFKNKKGVCSDYSRIFKIMCDQAGVESVIISGNARDYNSPYRSTQNNGHAWNAVKIDGEWKLVDATWGAGYTDPGVKKFTKLIKPGYFFTPPEWFIQNHMPNDAKWQLLEKPLSNSEFIEQAMVNFSQSSFDILDFAIEIETEAGSSKKQIWFLFKNPPKHMAIVNSRRQPIKFTRKDIDGKVILSFTSSARNITIFGGNNIDEKMEWVGMYKL
jgi:hypothetical protein